jgi:hypothetical protein
MKELFGILNYYTNEDCANYIMKFLHNKYMKDIEEHILPPKKEHLPSNWIISNPYKVGRKHNKMCGKKGEVYDGICFDDPKKLPVYNYLKIKYSIPLYVRINNGFYFNELIDMEAKLNKIINNYHDWCPWWIKKYIGTKVGCILHPLEVIYRSHTVEAQPLAQAEALWGQRYFHTAYFSNNIPLYARPPCVNNYTDRYEITFVDKSHTHLQDMCRENKIKGYSKIYNYKGMCKLIMKNPNY